MGNNTQLAAASQRQLLILGASSFVGRSLWQKVDCGFSVGTFYNTPQANLKYFDSVRMDVRDIVGTDRNFTHGVILLGDTEPDSCYSDPSRSSALNVESIIRIIDVLVERDITPVFISSQFVFDGVKGGYVEDDPVNPVLVYGTQKVLVEQYLREQTDNHLILRISKVCGVSPGDGTLFTAWVDSILDGVDKMRCANDQRFSPILVDDVVDAVLSTIEDGCIGTYHLAGPESYTRAEMLMMLLFKLNNLRDFNIEVETCSINDFNLPEDRPIDVSMKSDKLVGDTGLGLRTPSDICDQIVSNYLEQSPERILLT